MCLGITCPTGRTRRLGLLDPKTNERPTSRSCKPAIPDYTVNEQDARQGELGGGKPVEGATPGKREGEGETGHDHYFGRDTGRCSDLGRKLTPTWRSFCQTSFSKKAGISSKKGQRPG